MGTRLLWMCEIEVTTEHLSTWQAQLAHYLAS